MSLQNKSDGCRMLQKRFSNEDFGHPNKTGEITLIQESRGGERPFCHCLTVWDRLPFAVSSWLYLNTCVQAFLF